MSSEKQFRKILVATFTTKIAITLILILLFSTIAATSLIRPIRQDPAGPPKALPALSSIASSSMFAKIFNLGYTGPETGDDHGDGNGQDVGPIQAVNSFRINQNYNQRPQDEPAVTVNPLNGTVVVGANDYGIGGPVGGGVYTHLKGAAFPSPTYFPPFPLLCAGGSTTPAATVCAFEAPPIGTGDPALVWSARYNEYYYTSIGFAVDNCASGVFLYRSSNGLDWTRPVINRFNPTPTGGGLRTITYWDGGPTGQNCQTFNDKEWIAVDNTPTSPFYGRIYVTWSQFHFDPLATVYMSSPIVLAYSDDHGNTFSNPIDVTGTIFPNPNCTFFSQPANAGKCIEDQFSVPQVGTDGTVYVAFINGQHDGHRDQYLLTRVHPAGFTVEGAFLATYPVFDASDDYPTQDGGGQGRSTLCNSNFRMASTEGLAVKLDGTSGTNDKLYIAWADDRVKAGLFAGVTVGPRSSGYACPSGKMTDNDVFIISSSDHGATWTAPKQVNQDKPQGSVNNIDQFYPWVSANHNGQVVVLYNDRRYDTTPIPNKLSRTTVGVTTNLATWKEVLVQQFPTNYDDAFFGIGAFIGDYNNVLVTDSGTVYGVWTAVAPGKTDSDIYIAIFNISGS